MRRASSRATSSASCDFPTSSLASAWITGWSRTMAPVPAMGMVGNPALGGVAAEADARLRRVLAAIEGAK